MGVAKHRDAVRWERLGRDEARSDGIVNIVVYVGNAVGVHHHLALKGGGSDG